MERSNQHTNLTDEQLLQEYRSSKNNEWLGILLQRYTLLLLGVAMKYLKDKEQAADAVQQIFLKTLTTLPQGEIQNFKGWLYILMRNHCLQLLRDKTHLAGEEVLEKIPVQESESKEALWQHEHTLEQMSLLLKQLPAEQQQSIDLFYLQKLSYKEITDRTGFSFAQVKSYIQNGKRNLKQLLLKNTDKRRP